MRAALKLRSLMRFEPYTQASVLQICLFVAGAHEGRLDRVAQLHLTTQHYVRMTAGGGSEIQNTRGPVRLCPGRVEHQSFLYGGEESVASTSNRSRGNSFSPSGSFFFATGDRWLM